jgi:hypothetical protein
MLWVGGLCSNEGANVSREVNLVQLAGQRFRTVIISAHSERRGLLFISGDPDYASSCQSRDGLWATLPVVVSMEAG